MSGTSPAFDHWKNVSHLSIWQAACLMAGYDPRAMSDVTDQYGDGLTLDDEKDQIQSAIDTGEISVLQGCHSHIKETRLLKEDWLKWLHKIGMRELAHQLSYFPAEDTSSPLHSIAESEESAVDNRASREPYLRIGRNNRESVEAWVGWQASQMATENETIKNIADEILTLAEKRGYESERREMTVASITRMIPTGITGGRGKSKGQSKNLQTITFGKGEIKRKG